MAELLILGGDIFDKLPNMEELEIYFDLISCLPINTIIYSGNHEALKKNTTFLSSLKLPTELINPKVKVIDDFHTEYGIDFIPYNKLKEYHPSDIDFHSNVLCTHVRGEIPPHVKPEVNLNIFDRWDIVLAGDLHSYENCQRNILYPGSPMTTSFHRNKVDTGMIVLDLETLSHTWVKLDLPQLIRKTISPGDPMPSGEIDHVVYEVEGNLSELSKVSNSELLDKKIVTRNTESELILTSDMTIIQEIEEYLKYILGLPSDTIELAIMELHNYVNK